MLRMLFNPWVITFLIGFVALIVYLAKFSQGQHNKMIKAIAAGDIVLVEKILSNGFNVNKRIHFKNTETTFLHLSIRRNADGNWYEEVVETLIAQGGNVNAVDSLGQTPLHRACKREDNKIVKLLLENKAKIDIKDKSGKLPIDYVMNKELKELIQSYS